MLADTDWEMIDQLHIEGSEKLSVLTVNEIGKHHSDRNHDLEETSDTTTYFLRRAL